MESSRKGALADAPLCLFRLRGAGYCSSLVTSCCTLLACARAEMPVWLRISYFDMLEDWPARSRWPALRFAPTARFPAAC